jgi:hypothetical protein|tara:strand:- start:874 stop:1518 length:645 start_codon:yes stop_codon:yes gene_type:complete
MRNRSLSHDGLALYLDGTIQTKPKKWYRNLICNLFHSDYDDRLFDVIHKSRASTKALCAEFENINLPIMLDSAIYNTVNLILSNKNDYRFFLDVMQKALQTNDHTTAHMLYLVLTNKSLDKMKKPKRASQELDKVKDTYGYPLYEKHVHYWRTVSSDNILPSVIAFNNFYIRRKFMLKEYEAQEVVDFMEIFKYLEHDKNDILPVYVLKDNTYK